MTEVSVVIPTKNEEKTISICIEKIQRVFTEHHIDGEETIVIPGAALPGLVLIMVGFYFGLMLLRQYNQSGYFSMPFTMLAGFFIVVGILGVFIGLVLNVIPRLISRNGEK